MKLFNYTKWEVLETYNNNGVSFCVQVRMNRSSGFKEFKTNRITPAFSWCASSFPVEKINKLTSI